MALPPPRVSRPGFPLRLAVDLSHLRPGGENGGIKPFLFETLRWLGRQSEVEIQFCYLTCAATHTDVREELARVDDELICVRDDGAGELPTGAECAPREWCALPPPPDLLWRIGARVLYSPFGHAEFACPGICTIGIIVDLLHRDFPWSLDARQIADREEAIQQIVAVADRLQCNSAYVVSRLREHYDVPQERMFTVYNAVHGRFGAEALAPVSEQQEAPFLFYPANAWKHKNHEVLLLAYGMYRAAALTTGKRPWPLVLTGHEDARWEEMRALAGAMGILGENAVRFAGYVPSSEFARLWANAGALVFPSLHEGFGIPLVEAMEHNVPVLCGRDASLSEVGAEAGFFVDARRPGDLADGMSRITGDAALRRRLVEAGRQRLADFSQDREAGKLLDEIVQMAKVRPPYRPLQRGIFPDGWTEQSAMLALPGSPDGKRCSGPPDHPPGPHPCRSRLRLRTGLDTALGGFDVAADQPEREIHVDFRPTGEPLWIEVPDAANLNAADARIHGVRLRTVDLRLTDGREYPLFSAR